MKTHWTPAAQERNFLLQTVQTSIPPGCTPLVQPTDTGFAQPAKAAAKDVHEQQRSLLRQKARVEKTPPSFKIGPREMLQVVRAMTQRMHELNRERQTVLAEARAGGWLHWRPNSKTGRALDSTLAVQLGVYARFVMILQR